MAERWLVTGGTGQVGLALRRNPPPGVEIVAPGRDTLDLAAPFDADAAVAGMAAVINCAAYTAVDKAESEPELAARINAAAPAALAAAAARAGIPIVHVSTDYVFPADGTGPWREDAQTGPVSVYGKTKLDGERAVTAAGARHGIVRTAWVISADGNNFVKTMLRLGAEREELRVVADQHGTPTHAGELAAVLAVIARRLIDRTIDPGTWHCANAGETTWHALAEATFAEAAREGRKVPKRVEPIGTADYPTPARRPADSRLDCSKLADDFGLRLRPWQAAVKDIVATIAASQSKESLKV